MGIGPNFAYGNSEKTLLMSYGIEEFSICLQKANGAEGFITWGSSLNRETKRQSYASARVVGKHHWVTHLRNVTFAQPDSNSIQGGIPCGGDSSGCAAIIDSGTSLI